MPILIMSKFDILDESHTLEILARGSRVELEIVMNDHLNRLVANRAEAMDFAEHYAGYARLAYYNETLWRPKPEHRGAAYLIVE